MMEYCDNCRFYDTRGIGPEDAGDCRRYPPSLYPQDDAGPPFFCFPTAQRKDWCGEWKPIATPPGDA